MRRSTSARKPPVTLPGRLAPLPVPVPPARQTAAPWAPRTPAVQPRPAGQEAGAEGREAGDWETGPGGRRGTAQVLRQVRAVCRGD